MQFVYMVDNLSQVIAALDLVLYLPEDLSDLLFDGVGTAGLLFELLEIGEELLIDEIPEVIAGLCVVMIQVAAFVFRRGPAIPSIGSVEDIVVTLPGKRGFIRPIFLQVIQIFYEKQP